MRRTRLKIRIPDDKQLEVALVSLRRALEHEGALKDPDWTGVTFLAAAEG